MKRWTFSKLSSSFVVLWWLILCGNATGPVCPKTYPVRVSVKPLDLSRSPTTEAIKAAGQLGGELEPTHDFRSKAYEAEVNRSFGEAIEAWNRHEYERAAGLFGEHVKKHPESPWGSEAVLHTGCFAQYMGRYSEAREDFQWIINNNLGKNHHGAKVMLNKARLRLGALNASEDRFEEAKGLFRDLKLDSPDWRHRTYAAHWIQRLSRESAERLALRNCGVKALAHLLDKRGKKTEAVEILSIQPDSAQGHSLQSLSEISARFGFDLVALRVSLPELDALALPAIIHIKNENSGSHGHYWILEKAAKNNLVLLDPQSGSRFRQSREELSMLWSGIALVFCDGGSLPGTRLTKTEMGPIFGGCCGAARPEGNQGDPCPRKKECGDYGSPRWSVNMINMNLFVGDTPLWYSSPVGPPVEITLSYNAQSSIAYHEPFGNKWQFNYGSYLVVDPSGTVTVFMPDGRRDVYTPDGSGSYVHPFQFYNKLTKISENHFELCFPDDTVYVYNIPSGTGSLQPFLTEIRDAHGQSIQFGYDANVQLTTITDALGRSSSLYYNSNGLITRVSDPFGRSARFEYDIHRNLTKITDMGGYWSAFTYDADIYLRSIENARGKWQFDVEPADGLMPVSHEAYPMPGDRMEQNYRITVTNPLGGKDEYYYSGYIGARSWYVSPRDYVPYQSSSKNNYYNTRKTSYLLTTLSSHGEIRAISSPEGGSTSYVFDVNGNRTSVSHTHSDSTAHSITMTYNDSGRATSITDPRAVTTELTYAANEVDLVEIKNGLGSMFMAYNDTHRVISATSRLGHTTTMAYNSYGQVTSVVDPRSISTTYIYNSNHQLERIERDGETLSSFTYDTLGRVGSRADATGLTLVFDYDDLNHVRKVTYPDGKYISYTYSGCCPRLLDSVIDRSGKTIRYTYDELERPKEIKDPAGFTTTSHYDENGNVALLVDAKGDATSFTYDLDNRLIKKTFADGKSVSYAYDYAGLLTKRTNARGISATYTYDANDNMKTITYSDGTPQITYDYDDYNRMIHSVDGTGPQVYTYDNDSRLTGLDGPWTDDTLTFRYDEYAQTGLGTGLDIHGGRSISYHYDALNRLTGIQMGSQAISYGYLQASPQVSSLTRAKGAVTTYQYDALNRLLEISNKDSSSAVINRFAYTYNEEDLRSSELRTNAGATGTFQNAFTTYDYNQLNQLLGSTDPNQLFAYDDDGNMVQGYTPEGHPFAATYDAEDRLSSLQYTDGSNTIHKSEYSYTGTGALAVVKTYENDILVDEIRYIRSGFLALQERDSQNSIKREYTWGLDIAGGIGGLLNLRQDAQDYSYLYDGRGNVTALINTSQTIAAAYSYDAFGNILSKTGTLDQPYRFSTKEYNEQTGLSYYGYRYYAASLGRWLTQDPLGEGGGINLYGFVNSDPISKVDPFGLWGIGVNAGGTAEAGAGSGGGYQANSGVGVFGGGSSGVTAGGYTASGGFADSARSNQFVVGATAGLGGGAFITNANCTKQLIGPFDTWTLNLPIISFQYATDGSIWTGSVSVGKSWGFSFSRYRVSTTSASGDPCQ